MDREDRQQLDRVVELVRDVLGGDALGIFLFGSAVLGGLQPESDLDVLAVSRSRLTQDRKQRLVDRLLAISWSRSPAGRWRRVELTIVVESDIRPWRYPPRMDFQYGDWLRRELESGNLEPWPETNSDLATLLTMVRSCGTPLFGPSPFDLIDAVPPGDLTRAMADSIDALLADLDDDTRNVVLTLARIWTTVATGAIHSKADAADWALDRLPAEHRSVLVRARAIYVGEQPEQWDDLASEVRPFARYVVSEINRDLAAAASIASRR